MKNLFLVGSFNNWEVRQQFRFAPLAGSPATLLADLPAGTHEFQIVMNEENQKIYMGAEGSNTQVSLKQLSYLRPEGANLLFTLEHSGIYFFSLELSKEHPILRVEAKYTRTTANAENSASLGLGHFLNMKLPVTFEVGRAVLQVADATSLGQGSVVELDRMVGEPLKVYIGGQLVALGEVVVVNEQFGVRVLEVLPTDGFNSASFLGGGAL